MIKLPNEINNAMRLYRLGVDFTVPHVYVDFHCKLANWDMIEQDWVILEDHGLIHDGWCDGAKFKQLVVAYKENGEYKVATVKWHESGAWFRDTGHGWARFKEMVIEP